MCWLSFVDFLLSPECLETKFCVFMYMCSVENYVKYRCRGLKGIFDRTLRTIRLRNQYLIENNLLSAPVDLPGYFPTK